jgi:acylphosphatase
MAEKAIEAIVEGRLQGVGYRSSIQQRATRLGIKGYIRNWSGNQVKIIAQGEENELEELIDFVSQGPRRAEVRECEISWIEPEGDYFRFSIKY